MTAPPIVAVVLAGGEGRRMGGRKPLQPWGEGTLLSAALRIAGGYAPRTAVAVRAAGQVPAGVAELILDDPAIEGPLAGLASAIAFAERAGAFAVVTLPVDAPLAPPDLVDRLRPALDADHPAAMAESGGRLHPTFALWRADLGPALAAYAAGGGRSLRGFAEAVGARRVDWGEIEPDPFANANTPDELARLASRA